MKIEVEDERVMNFALGKKFLDGDGDVIEIAESPALESGTGVVAWRTDQTKGGFAIVSQIACQNGSSRGEETDVIKQRIPLDRLDMGPSMDPFDVPLKSGVPARQIRILP